MDHFGPSLYFLEIGETNMEDEAPPNSDERQNADRNGVPGDAANDKDQHQDGVPAPSLPPIEPVADDQIHVGAGGPLIVPREDIGDDLDVGEDLDLAAMQAKKIRKPQRHERFFLNPASELPTRLLLHKPNPDGIEVEHYYVSPELRSSIADELKMCRVFVYFSLVTKTHALWIVNVTVDNSWYESLAPLFRKPADFFSTNWIRVSADKKNSKYRVKHKLMVDTAIWPAKTTSELLGEALGPDKFITSADHPLYRDLIDGIDLT